MDRKGGFVNAIIFYNFEPPMVNGSLINAIEYFLCAYEHNKGVYLYFINTTEITRKQFIELIKDRYKLDGLEGYENNIVTCLKNDLIRIKFNTVLVFDYATIKKTKGLINADKILVVSDALTTNLDYLYSKKAQNVIYYGEMPFQYKDYRYTMKMLFSRFKEISTCEKTTYIHSPKNPDTSFVEALDLPDQPIMFRQPGHMKSLFSKFDTFVYYHAHTWFDPTPRLMHESYFYNKKIVYINEFKFKDGSWYRYKDLMKFGLVNRYLNAFDVIIGQLI